MAKHCAANKGRGVACCEHAGRSGGSRNKGIKKKKKSKKGDLEHHVMYRGKNTVRAGDARTRAHVGEVSIRADNQHTFGVARTGAPTHLSPSGRLTANTGKRTLRTPPSPPKMDAFDTPGHQLRLKISRVFGRRAAPPPHCPMALVWKGTKAKISIGTAVLVTRNKIKINCNLRSFSSFFFSSGIYTTPLCFFLQYFGTNESCLLETKQDSKVARTPQPVGHPRRHHFGTVP